MAVLIITSRCNTAQKSLTFYSLLTGQISVPEEGLALKLDLANDPKHKFSKNNSHDYGWIKSSLVKSEYVQKGERCKREAERGLRH